MLSDCFRSTFKVSYRSAACQPCWQAAFSVVTCCPAARCAQARTRAQRALRPRDQSRLTVPPGTAPLLHQLLRTLDSLRVGSCARVWLGCSDFSKVLKLQCIASLAIGLRRRESSCGAVGKATLFLQQSFLLSLQFKLPTCCLSHWHYHSGRDASFAILPLQA